MSGKKITRPTNNPIIRNALGALINLNPTTSEALKKSAEKAIKVLDSNKKAEPGIRKQDSVEDNPLKEIGGFIGNKNSVDENKTPQAKVGDKKSNENPSMKVLEYYISDSTDIETIIAYIKRFGSQELLQKIEEKLKEREDKKYYNLLLCVDAEEEIEHQEAIYEGQSNQTKNDYSFNEDESQKLLSLDELIDNFDPEKHGEFLEYIITFFRLSSNPELCDVALKVIKALEDERKTDNFKRDQHNSNSNSDILGNKQSNPLQNSKFAEVLMSLGSENKQKLLSAILQTQEHHTQSTSHEGLISSNRLNKGEARGK
jgi:hypothetical protein